MFQKSLVFACLMAIITLSTAVGQEKKEYRKDFSDQDLTDKKFDNQDLPDTNFENADLTNTSFRGAKLSGSNFQGAAMKNAVLADSDLTGADFRKSILEYPSFYGATLNKANLSGLDLSKIQFSNTKLREADLRNVKAVWSVYGADLFGADLRGANFSACEGHSSAKWRKVKYDRKTRWPKDFDPEAVGAVLVEEEEEEPPVAKSTKPTPPKGAAAEKAFTKLDINADGVLSGKEARPYAKLDQNEDAEITLDEFVAGYEE